MLVNRKCDSNAPGRSLSDNLLFFDRTQTFLEGLGYENKSNIISTFEPFLICGPHFHTVTSASSLCCFVISLLRKRELVTLLLSCVCLCSLLLFMLPCAGMWSVIVAFQGHTRCLYPKMDSPSKCPSVRPFVSCPVHIMYLPYYSR